MKMSFAFFLLVANLFCYVLTGQVDVLLCEACIQGQLGVPSDACISSYV